MRRLLLAVVRLTLLMSAILAPAFASGHVRHLRHRVVNRRSIMRPRLQPVPPLNLAGRVILPGGAPAPGATVYVAWNTQNGTVPFEKIPVDSGGNFKQTKRLPNAVPGSMVNITAYVPDKGWCGFSAPPHSRQFSHLKLQLQPGVTLTGRLIRTNGSPAANTEVHAETLFPGGPEGGMGIGAMVFTSPSGSSAAPLIPYDYMLRLVPDGAAPLLFHTKTDAQGRFALTGLPRRTSVLVRPEKGLILTPNSMSPLTLNATAKQDAGALIVTQTGSARIRVTDVQTHKPQQAVAVALTPVHTVFTGGIFYHSQPPFNTNETMATDTNGIAETKNLLPGTYRVAVMGRVQQINVEEGRAMPTVEFALRAGPLNGRLLDAAGKPLSGINIMMNTATGSTQVEGEFGKSKASLSFDSLDGPFVSSRWEKNAITTTGPDGSFSVPQFPWGSQQVILRATKGNDRAEYVGAVSRIGSSVELRMKPNVLVSVSGRLIDTHRRPVAQLACQALHWLPSLRPTWFASAHDVRADAKGRFRVDGLERGESFSIISNGQQVQFARQQAAASRPGFQTAALKSVSPVTNFESPRFVASRDAGTQDLGDVMVHPSTTPDEVLQSYGAAQRQIANMGVLEAPAAPAVAQAQAALQRYQQALRSGDVTAAHLLTSHLAPGYAASLPEFLRQATLSGTAAPQTDGPMRALRFVPRSLIASIKSPNAASPMLETISSRQMSESQLNFRNDVFTGETETASFQSEAGFSSPGSDTAAEKDWIVLTAKRDNNLVAAGILHCEGGQWRVVSSGTTASLPLVNFVGVAPQAAGLERKAPVLPIERYAGARDAGERYLRLWAENRPAAMLKATSSHSLTFAKSLTDYQKSLEARPDEGICPLPSGAVTTLHPVANLTAWEQEWLAQQARMRGMNNRMVNPGAFSGETGGNSFPHGFLKRGDLALLEYSTPSGRFLMELLHQKDGWKVLEPSMPL